MKTVAVLAHGLQKAGIRLFRDGDNIRYKTSSGYPDVAVLEELSRRRDELLLYFRANDSLDASPPQHKNRSFLPSVTQEMWWHWIDPETSLTLSLIEFIKDSSTPAVVTAIRGMVALHDTLRSRFSQEIGILALAFNAADEFEVETEVLSPSIPTKDLKNLIDTFLARPLVAGDHWLIRAKVFHVPDKGHVAVIAMNHIVADGTSIDILRTELRQRVEKGGLAPLRRRTLSYANFTSWQRSCLARSGSALVEYWSAWARNQPELLSPVGKVSMQWRSGKKVRRTFTIPAVAQTALARFARDNSTFPFLVYLTMLALSVERWCGQSRFAIRSICDGRIAPDLSFTVGLMTGADTINISLNRTHGFMESLREIEAEYHVARRLRLPNIYAVPPFSVTPGDDDQSHNVPIVINYRKTNARLNRAHSSYGAWPPLEGIPRQDIWRHPVSPICVELTQLGEVTNAAFLMHEDIVSAPEQTSFIQTFFAVFEETTLQSK